MNNASPWPILLHGKQPKQQLREDNIARTILRGQYCNLLFLQRKLGCKMLYRLYLLFSFYSPDSSIFRMILFFVREETWIVARFTMEYPPRTQLRCLLFFFCLQNRPLGQSYEWWFMFRWMTIHVSMNDDSCFDEWWFMFRLMTIHVPMNDDSCLKTNHLFKRWMSATRMSW